MKFLTILKIFLVYALVLLLKNFYYLYKISKLNRFHNIYSTNFKTNSGKNPEIAHTYSKLLEPSNYIISPSKIINRYYFEDCEKAYSLTYSFYRHKIRDSIWWPLRFIQSFPLKLLNSKIRNKFLLFILWLFEWLVLYLLTLYFDVSELGPKILNLITDFLNRIF